MSLFDRFRRRPPPGRANPSAETAAELGAFMASRAGVEAFIEPPTAVYAMTLCLVAGDGEHLRRPIKDQREAHKLCAEHGVPLYDARIVGYPQRMRDYDQGVRGSGVRLEDLPPLDIIEQPGGQDGGGSGS